MPRYVWWILYLVCMSFIVSGMFSMRRSAIKTYETPQAQTAWDQWRDKAKADSGADGPVMRKDPQSKEPPALVLMRDHFVACLAFAMLLSSILFVTLAVMFQGAIARAPKPRQM